MTWAENEAAEGYYVYRYSAEEGWVKIGIIKENATTSYLDETAVKGTKYYYTVKAYSGSSVSAYLRSKAVKKK